MGSAHSSGGGSGVGCGGVAIFSSRGKPCNKYPPSDIRHLYILERKQLGKGAFGTVVRARHRVSGRYFAVKMVKKERRKNLSLEDLFMNEASIMKKMDHENILKFHEKYVSDTCCYGVFDLCLGGELFAEIRRVECFTEHDAVFVLQQILSAIQYCHSRGFMHRDVKAENFLYETNDDNSRIVLIDFGLSCPVPKGKKLKTVCGSPRYIAPEVLQKSYDEKSDIWNIGVMTYLMLYGCHPFGDRTTTKFQDIYKEILNNPVDYTPFDGYEAPSKKAISFMQRCLERNPAKRMSASEALQHEWLNAERNELRSSVIDADLRKMAVAKINDKNGPTWVDSSNEAFFQLVQ